MYIQRALKNTFHSCISQFPAVMITGPGQSGKSAFLQHEMKDTPYVTFDDSLNRNFASQDPNGFLDQFDGQTVILDDIQYVPEILPYIKIKIDKDRTSGKWIMTSSREFHMMKNLRENLAGRIAILELYPFSLGESDSARRLLEEVLWTGLYPEPSCYSQKRDVWIQSYVQNYIEKDVRQIENIRNLRSFEIFINQCAALHSQEFRAATLARHCGMSQPTVKTWVDILEISYLCVILPPLFKDFGKRSVKAPKFYFNDPLLVSYLTQQPSAEAAIRGNMGGMLFEGLVVSDVWKTFLNRGKKPPVFFWRSQGGPEVDLIIQARGKLWPIEINLTSAPVSSHLREVNRFKEIAGNEASRPGVIVCDIPEKKDLPGGNMAIPWFAFSEWLEENLM
ncbi:AAA family ATPase [Desulfococcaceae bacterium HSG8]|nr:AAA family ATPase [Desulfococcaceae bacterium HSG8]